MRRGDNACPSQAEIGTGYYSMLTTTIPPVGNRIKLGIGQQVEDLLRPRRRERSQGALPHRVEDTSPSSGTEKERRIETSYAARGRRQAVVRVSAKWIVSSFDGTVLARDRSTSAKGGESEALW